MTLHTRPDACLEVGPGSLEVCCGVTLHTRSDGCLKAGN